MDEDALAALAEQSLRDDLGLGPSRPVASLPGDRQREEAELFARIRPASACAGRIALLRDRAHHCLAEAAALQAGAARAGGALALPGDR
jgi:hypothetical protein